MGVPREYRPSIRPRGRLHGLASREKIVRSITRKFTAVVTAAGVGALAAILRRRTSSVEVVPGPLPAAPVVQTPPPPAAGSETEAQAAIDEARDRLRARAEALRREIDGEGAGAA